MFNVLLGPARREPANSARTEREQRYEGTLGCRRVAWQHNFTRAVLAIFGNLHDRSA